MTEIHRDKDHKLDAVATKILTSDLDDLHTYIDTFQFLTHLLRHVPEDELDYWLYEHADKHREFLRALGHHVSPELTVIDGGRRED